VPGFEPHSFSSSFSSLVLERHDADYDYEDEEEDEKTEQKHVEKQWFGD
jgi:hypothetical protein